MIVVSCSLTGALRDNGMLFSNKLNAKAAIFLENVRIHNARNLKANIVHVVP